MGASVIPHIVSGVGYKSTHYGAACASCGWVARSKFGGPNAESKAQAVAGNHVCESGS